MQTETHENKYGRGRFLRQLGVTLAFALGAGGLASAARADHTAGHCCQVTDPVNQCPDGPHSCTGENETLYRCNCTGISEDYCACFRFTPPPPPQCFQGPC
jgi:hypothetical protein